MPDLHPLVRRFIEDTGHLSQSLGVGKVAGRIFAYLYFSREPRNLADLQQALAISKGGASMGVRQLEQWGAVRKVWVKGDRKDYYRANDWFGQILKQAALDTVGKKLAAFSSMLDGLEKEVSAHKGDGEIGFIRDRVKHMRRFQKRARLAWSNPLFRRLLE